MSETLKGKALNSVKWTTLYTIFLAASAPIYKIVLAKLLTPEDFAYIAVLSVFTGIATLINNLGLGEAIIQKDSVSSQQISTLFFFDIIKSILCGTILYLSAGLFSNLFEMDKLGILLKITAFSTIIFGSSSTLRVCLQKKMVFKDLSIIQGVKVFLEMGSTIILILSGYDILGVALGTLISKIGYTILILRSFSKKSGAQLQKHFSVREIIPFFKFGISVSLKQVLTFITQQLDIVLIGALFSNDVLGIYYFAKDLLQKPQQLMTQSFTQVLFPMFARLKNDYVRLSQIYNRVSLYISLIAFPIFIGIAVTAQLFVPLLFGEEWIGSISIIRVFSITSIFQVLSANISTSLLYSVNRPNIVLYIDLISNCLYFTSLLLLHKLGMVAILVLYSIYIIAKTLVLQYYVSDSLNRKFREYIFQFKGIVLSTILMMISVLLIGGFVCQLSKLIQLIVLIFMGGMVYIISVWKFDSKIFKEILSFLKAKINRRYNNEGNIN